MQHGVAGTEFLHTPRNSADQVPAEDEDKAVVLMDMLRGTNTGRICNFKEQTTNATKPDTDPS